MFINEVSFYNFNKTANALIIPSLLVKMVSERLLPHPK